eukprot:Em0009g448a
MNLASWGLGLKRLSFPREASSAEIDTIVYGSFPQLSGRGYDILRTGPKCKSLVVIATPPGGMTIPYMMDIVQQSKLYIRPKDHSLVEQLQTDVADASKNCSESDDSSDKSPRAFRSKGAERAVEVSSSASDMEQQSSPFVSLLDESEEEFDKQLKLAISASLLESNAVVDAVETESIPFKEALKKLCETTIKPKEYQRITIRRSHIFDDSIRLFQKGVCCNKPFKVTFIGEPAVDLGGPLREYFTVMMRAIAKNSSLFEGRTGQRVLRSNVSAVLEKTYLHVGRMMGASLLQGGSPPTFLANSIVDYMLYGIEGVQLRINNIPDIALQKVLKELEDASSVSEFQGLLDNPVLSHRIQLGIDKPSTHYHLTDKSHILRILCIHQTILSSKGQIDQMMEGLNEHGLLSLMKKYPECARVMLSNATEVLTAAAMIDLFQVEYSSCGSNNRQKEEASIIMFYDYLQDIEDGKVFLSTEPTKVQMALEKVLQFTTGSRSIPPLGFDSSPTINFCHDPAVTLPTSNTCSMSITLPTAIINVDTFSSRMTYGIGNSLGCLGHV